MAALTSDTDSCVLAANNKDEILDDILNSQTDDIAVEISPVEGYSEIKMLSSPFGAAMLSPGSEIIKNDNILCLSPTDDNNGSVTGNPSGSSNNENIPQWKIDLIQRRKINIARTIGANQSVTCPKKGFLDALETTKPQKQEEDVTKITSPTSVLPLTKPNLFILKSPNNSNNNSNSTNSNSLDDSNSSEYLEVNLHGSSQNQDLNNDDDDIDGLNSSIIPAKNTIKTQHKQQYNNYKYGDNNDIKSNNDDEIDNSDYNIETGISGGQYTINNMKNINKAGNTVIIKSPQKDQQQQTTSQIKNNYSTPIPKQRYSLNQINNISPTGDTLLTTSVAAPEHLINNNISNTTNISNTGSSLCSETTSNNLNNTDIINSSVSSSSISDEQQQQQLSSALLPSSSLSTTSSNQLHSKHDTVKFSNEIAASSSSLNELINTTTVGLGNNNLTINNKKCGIVSTNQNFLKSSNTNSNNNNNKYIKNPQNSSTTIQKIKIKKMVSAQDINDSAGTTTTTTAPTINCHNQTPPTILLDDNDSTLSQFNDFDSSEELQYGPGIVSKLRVRYLSLALRQTTAKQRTHLDNLRRATSLNNLLDGGGSTGSTNDGSIIDGDIENESHLNVHHHQQQILNNITHQQQNNHNQQQNKIHKNVSWLNQKEQQNSNSLIKNYIKEQEYLNSNIDNDDDDHIENSKEFDIEKNNGKFLYEKNYKKPENFYNNKTGINNYQQNIQKKELLQQQQRNGRQVKRGNDSLKRARSVEALLCEKSSWLNNNNKNNTSISGKMSISSGDDCRSDGGEMLLVTEKPESNEINLIGIDNNIIVGNNQKNLLNQHNIVTIEDKIVNARERLHTTTEKLSPPKRLTSFIDDTERPPPDLVKQTLKLFEATANRRNGRNLSRNTNSQVAVKIANYKSIISQEKPIISYPKPPLSPKRNNPTSANNVIVNKKPNTLDLKTTTTKSNNVGKKSNNSPVNSPVSSLTKKFSGIENNETDSSKYKSPISNQQLSISPTAVTPPQILPRNNLNHQTTVSTTDSPITHLTNKLNRLKIQNNNSDNQISPQERTPDIIPRKHFENFNNQTTDSPITQLSKKLNNLNIQNSPVVTSSSSTTDVHNKNQFTAKSIDELTDDTDDSITTSDDDPDGCINDGVTKMTKRISKTALENISKAGTTQHFSFNNNISSSKMNNDQLNHSTPAKQIGIIRPLVAELKKDNSSSSIVSGGGSSGSSSSGACSTDNIKPQRDNLVISNLIQTKNQFNNNNNTSKTKLIDNTKTGKNSAVNTTIDKPALTTREIEKNLINEKKNELANLETTNNSDGGSIGISTPPIWQLNKKIKIGSHNGQPIETQNNIMVFNFQDRKDVPDYIENDGLLIKRRRELPKPNESGFVLLGDLTLETSTDPDESWTMGPPSPCNVEFENANIIIDGKSNLRYRSKEISLRVQFDDTLTSTFEYPSESSFSDDSVPTAVESFSSTIDSLEHIDADEIIQIPNLTPITTIKSPTSITMGQKSLGNMSLGSAPLGSYTPVKAQIQTNFELGITRVPNNTTQMNGSSTSVNDNSNNQQINEGGTSKDIINSINNATSNNNKSEIKIADTAAASNDDINAINDKINESDSLQYLKPATDDLTVVYSEGTQKTDLLY